MRPTQLQATVRASEAKREELPARKQPSQRGDPARPFRVASPEQETARPFVAPAEPISLFVLLLLGWFC